MTSVAYLSDVDQEPWRIVAEDASQVSTRPGIKMLGAEEEKESNVTLRKERESYNNVITYFHEIIRVATYECGDIHLPSITTAQTGHRWMDGERQRIELSKVSPVIQSAMSRREGQG